MKYLRSLLTSYDIRLKSEKIFNNLIKNTDILSKKRICTYVSSFSEPDTFLLMRYLLDIGKEVIVPITDIKTKTISLSKINNLNFKKGAYSIPEPEISDIVDFNYPDFIIVPGISFDKMRNRVGFGLGYYDKFLSCANGETVALCYDFQIVDSINSEIHDIKLDKIVSDTTVL